MPSFSPGVSSSSKSSPLTWKCPFCGAMNEDENMICDGCGDERPAAPSIARTKPNFGPDTVEEEELQSDSDSSSDDKLEADDTDEKEDLVESPEPPTKLDNENEDYESPTAVMTPLPTPSITVEEDEETPPIRLDTQYEDFEPPKVVPAPLPRSSTREIGRASCRERV